MKIALFLNSPFSMWNFRKGLICALRDRGFDVYVLTPEGPDVSRITSLGVNHIPIPVNRFISPLSDLRLLWRLFRVFRRMKFDLVHNMTIKPNIYGTLAARLAGIPKVVGLVSGLGYTFLEKPVWKQKILRFFATQMYRIAGKFMDRVWFQNEEDLSFFVESGILSKGKAVLIRSGGINLEEFSPESVDPAAREGLRAELKVESSTLLVVMIARATWSKGVREFVEASEAAATWGRKTRFILVGWFSPESPDGVPEEYLRKKESAHFKWMGFRADIKEIIALSDIMVLPSFYREGIPRSLLEGLSLGKPIVTTDNVGCRETVDDGWNGYIVPVRDSERLTSAIRVLVEDDDRRREFGIHSRQKARREFDEISVVNRIISRVYEIPS